MAEYRVYLLDGSGRIVSAVDRRCDSDDEARDAARGLVAGSGEAEVWQGTRCLGRIAVQPQEATRLASRFPAH